MRERLIEMIQKSVGGCARNWAEIIADYLLANGVVVPPCKVGDMVYWYHKRSNKICESVVEGVQIFFGKDTEGEKTTIFVYNIPDNMGVKELGNNAFLSKEKAMQALKERF